MCTSLGALVVGSPMRLSKDTWFRVELALTGAVVALGLGSLLYAVAGSLGAAWHWLTG